MTIDLKWALPFVLPFPILLTARLLFFVAGAVWYPAEAVGWSISFGALFDLVFALEMHEKGARWDITIRGRND